MYTHLPAAYIFKNLEKLAKTIRACKNKGAVALTTDKSSSDSLIFAVL
jgi:hypothetical protein